jgi:PAS domain S-box-containing protein
MNAAKILIVEDEFVVANDIEARLISLGYSVVAKADNGAEAIELARAVSPDLVLMDIRLRGAMDGIAAAEQIHERFNLPIVFLTAYADESTLQRAKNAAPFGYILKPFEDRELRTNIEIAVYKHRADIEIRRLTRLYATLSQVNQAIVRAVSREELFPKICEIALEFGRFQSARFDWLDTKTGTLVKVAGAGSPERLIGSAGNNFCGCALDAIRQGTPFLVNELPSHSCSLHCQTVDYAPLRSCAAYPIRLLGMVCGAFVVGTDEAGFFSQEESRLLEEIALDISFALDFFEKERQRKQSEDALKEREEHLDTIVHGALDGFALVDMEGCFKEVNDSFCAMTGYGRDELLHMRILDLECAEAEGQSAQYVQRIVRDGSDRITNCYRRKTGEVIDVEVSQTFQSFDGGRCVCFTRDVTAQKQSRKALEASERFAKAALDSLSAHIAILDETGKIIAVNRAWRQFARDNPPSLSDFSEGENYLDICNRATEKEAQDARCFAQGIRNVLARTVPEFSMEYPCHSPSERRWFVGRVTPFAGDGPPRIVIAHENITQRKLTENALSASEALLTQMGTTAKIGGWELDVLTKEGRWTEEVARIHDLDPSIQPSMDMGVRFYTGDSRKQMEAVARRALENGSPYDLELEFVSAKGTHKWVRTIGEPVIEDGRVIRLHGSLQDITERKQTENALKESESRFSKIFHTSPVGINVIRLSDGRSIDANQAFLKMVGYSREEVVNHTSAELGLFVDPDLRTSSMQRLNSGEAIINHATKVRHKSGEFRDVLGSVDLIDFNGVRMGLVLMSDITDLKRTEDELRYRNMILSTQQEASMDGILVVDQDSRIVSFNRQFLDLWDVPAELVHDNYDEKVLQHVCDQVADPEQFLNEVMSLYQHHEQTSQDEIPLADGRVIERYSAPLLGDDKTYRGRVWYFRDISARKHAQSALLASEAKFRSYVKNAPFAVLVADKSGRILDTNPAAVAMFGWDEATFKAMHVTQLHPIAEREKVLDALDGLQRNGHLQGEFSMVRRHGDLISVSLRAGRLTDGGSIAFLEDISSRKHAEERMKALQEQLFHSQKMEAVGRLAGGVAHDFNNLLMVIRCYADLLHEGLAPDDGYQKYTKQIILASERAAGLTGQLLAFSRKQIAAPVVIDLNLLITETMSMLRRLVGEDVRLEFHKALSLWAIKADPDQMVQILMNLCVNSRDAMPSGGTLTINTRNVVLDDNSSQVHGMPIMPPGDYVELSVADTGVGISKEIQSRMFEPFFTTKGVGKGTGLGLSTVYGIVDQNGGKICVESDVERGTCFTILLPGMPDVAAVPLATDVGALERGTETVLVVEDEVALRTMIANSLRNLGYTVLEAESGHDAIGMAADYTDRIDLLLTDVVMPQMGGRKLSESLLESRPDLRVIYMSGYTDDAVVRHGIRDAAVTFLQKPFKIAALSRKVRSVLGPDRNTKQQ